VVAGEYFVAASARQDDRQRPREAVVDIASRIEPAWLEEFFPQSITRVPQVRYDEAAERVIATKQTRYLDLVLREETDPTPDRAAVATALAEALLPRVREVIAADEPLTALTSRIRFAALHAPQHSWPTFDDAGWRALLVEAAQGKQSLRQVTQSLRDAVRHRLLYPLDRLLEELAPETLTVPTGSAIALTYNSDPNQSPVLAVRLQELFGLAETPRIAGGRVPVLLHLLGPNYRPVQVTQDLASFWKNTYAQVRRDLRADYPKHSWPDDPLTAEAIRGAKRRPR
jgi:ATP-dependent helicase HrpB